MNVGRGLLNVTKIFPLVLALAAASCTQPQRPIDVCKEQPEGKCVRNEAHGSKNPSPSPARETLCKAGEIRTPTGCQDGARFCAAQEMEFQGSDCAPCHDDESWDRITHKCAKAENGSAPEPISSPSASPSPGATLNPSISQSPGPTQLPTPAPSPSAVPLATPAVAASPKASASPSVSPQALGPAPKAEIKLATEGGLRVLVRFSSTVGVSEVKYAIAANAPMTFSGKKTDKNRKIFEATDVSIPVTLTFDFGGKHCSVVAKASIKGSGFMSPVGC